MAINTSRVTIIANAPRVKVYTATAPARISIVTDGSSLFIGNRLVTLANGFKMGETTITLDLKVDDEIWAIGTTDTVLSVIAQT